MLPLYNVYAYERRRCEVKIMFQIIICCMYNSEKNMNCGRVFIFYFTWFLLVKEILIRKFETVFYFRLTVASKFSKINLNDKNKMLSVKINKTV